MRTSPFDSRVRKPALARHDLVTHMMGMPPTDMPVSEITLPSGDLVPGVLLKDHVLELGPGRSLGIGARIRIDGREAEVVGRLRGRRQAVPGLWDAGTGVKVVFHWSDEPVR